MKRILYTAILIVAIISCNRKQENVESESDFVIITSSQFQTDSMALGSIEKRVFEDIIKCNGTIVPLPNGIASVGTQFAGIIDKVNCTNGQYVEKGDILIEISGNEIIDLQKDFAEAAAKYYKAKSEYERAKSLYDEKVGSEKDFITTETEFFSAKGNYNGLKLKIESIGLSPERIEKGDFNKSYSLECPINGYVSELNAKLGSYIDQQTNLLDVINPKMSQIKLSIFSNDIQKLKKNQSVRFKPINNDTYYTATLSFIGSNINEESKTIDCYATINDNLLDLVSNTFVESELIIATDSVNAIPLEAILKSENEDFVLQLNSKNEGNFYFQKVPIKTGRKSEKYIEILSSKTLQDILIKGTYNINL
ncbi:MAG: efflux RND transporter periplasmic adaptor subunit [Bacteroidales bacterium]